ncbi:MAG: cytochrome c3 family protein [Opitutus sp.]
MIARLRRIKTTLIFGGTAAWGLLLVSCVMVSRTTMMAPPQIAGAQFVGSNDCAQCHEDITSNFHDATHAKLMAEGENAKNIGCESCHGPGSIHSQQGGGAGTIVNPEKNPDTCFQCHLEKRGEFALPSSHPVDQIGCSACHDSHRGDSVAGGGTDLMSASESCVQCHEAQRGPYVFEHEALRDNCTICHSPHGSTNQKMLKSSNATLCLQCHQQQQTIDGAVWIGGRNHGGATGFLSRGACWTSGCHEAVHGSHVNSSLRF